MQRGNPVDVSGSRSRTRGARVLIIRPALMGRKLPIAVGKSWISSIEILTGDTPPMTSAILLLPTILSLCLPRLERPRRCDIEWLGSARHYDCLLWDRYEHPNRI